MQKEIMVSQQLTFKDDIEAILPLFWWFSVQFTERVLKNMWSCYMHRQIFASHSFVQAFQFVPEVAPLHVKVQHPCVIDQDTERPLR